jgi:outer membrane immunogenic protein
MIDMKRLILGVAAALMLGVGQTAADGLPSRGGVRGPEAPEVRTLNWTGFYIGAGVGYGALDLNFVDLGTDDLVNVNGEGFLGTAVIGFDRQFGSWVAGVFADVDFSDISENVGASTLDHNYSWAVGARLGGLVTPKTLLYGTVGYTQAEFALDNNEQLFDGYFVGAGIEHLLHQNWTLKLEYRYADYEAQDVVADAELHTARVVLSYKFGGPRY